MLNTGVLSDIERPFSDTLRQFFNNKLSASNCQWDKLDLYTVGECRETKNVLV